MKKYIGAITFSGGKTNRKLTNIKAMIMEGVWSGHAEAALLILGLGLFSHANIYVLLKRGRYMGKWGEGRSNPPQSTHLQNLVWAVELQPPDPCMGKNSDFFSLKF